MHAELNVAIYYAMYTFPTKHMHFHRRCWRAKSTMPHKKAFCIYLAKCSEYCKPGELQCTTCHSVLTDAIVRNTLIVECNMYESGVDENHYKHSCSRVYRCCLRTHICEIVIYWSYEDWPLLTRCDLLQRWKTRLAPYENLSPAI